MLDNTYQLLDLMKSTKTFGHYGKSPIVRTFLDSFITYKTNIVYLNW